MVGLCVFGLHYSLDRRHPTGRRRQSAGRSLRRVGGARVELLESRRLLAAAPVSAGAEFRVNTNTIGSQELFAEAPHAVATDADGDFVVTWSSSGQDGSSWGVYAQRYGSDGVKLGAEFRANQATSNSQWHPNVACDAAGNFVVTWTSALQDGSGDGVYARRFTADGVPLGGEFRVNTTIAGDQRHPSIAMAAEGSFVVTWSGFAQAGGAAWDIYGQRYDALGNRQGAEFRVNATTAGDQQYAAVASDHAGNFIVTWTTDSLDGSGTAVYAHRFSAAGAAQGGEFRVNTSTEGNQQYARVGADADGDFVVAWASASQDGSGRGIYAQRFARSGGARGGEFRVNVATAGEQFAPTIASDDAGGFVVTWTGAQDGDSFGVFARAYDAAGAARGGEFRVNSHAAGNQVYSAAASSGDGKLVLVWQSDGQDGSFFGVYGQRYAAPDATPPVANVVDITPDPRVGGVGAIVISFSEPVTGVDLSDVRLTRDGGPNLLTVQQAVTFSNGGATWTVGDLSALTAIPGAYTFTVVAASSGITDAAGNPLAASASDAWTVATQPPARVVGRYVFYNGSSFDGHDALAGASDDDAIAIDKEALLPTGGRAGFANYTSYPQGLNGIMIDVAGLAIGASPEGSGTAPIAAEGAALVSVSDFAFRFGNTTHAAEWGPAPAPAALGIRPGAGVGGSDRVTILWSDRVIAGGWLQLTVLATASTRLMAPDVFYFGNLPGETGDHSDSASIDAGDLARTRAAIPSSDAGLDSHYDHNRDGRVDVRDLYIVRSAIGSDPLPLIGTLASAVDSSAAVRRTTYRPCKAGQFLSDRDDSANTTMHRLIE